MFSKIVLTNFKPLTAGTIYRPPNQSNFLEVLNENMDKTFQSITKFTFLATLALICF